MHILTRVRVSREFSSTNVGTKTSFFSSFNIARIFPGSADNSDRFSTKPFALQLDSVVDRSSNVCWRCELVTLARESQPLSTGPFPRDYDQFARTDLSKNEIVPGASWRKTIKSPAVGDMASPVSLFACQVIRPRSPVTSRLTSVSPVPALRRDACPGSSQICALPFPSSARGLAEVRVKVSRPGDQKVRRWARPFSVSVPRTPTRATEPPPQ